MTSRYLIYGLADPRDGQLRYVGKSTSGMRRPLHHVPQARYGLKTHCARWIRQLLVGGCRPRIVILQEFQESDILSYAERHWILYFRGLGFPLTNMTDGGEGGHGPTLPETRKKIAAKLKGNTNAAGRVTSEASRKRFSEGQLLSWSSPTRRQNSSGKPMSPKVFEALQGGAQKWRESLSPAQQRAEGLKMSRALGGKPVISSSGQIFDSVAIASKETGIADSNIRKVLSGERKTAGGLSWKKLGVL